MANYLKYSDIYTQVCNSIGDTSQARLAEVKAVIDMVYREVQTCDELHPMFWMMDMIDDVKTKIPATITGISVSYPCIITANAHGFSSGDIVQLCDIGGMTELEDRIVVVNKIDANSFYPTDIERNTIDASTFTAFTSGGYIKHRGVTLTKPIYQIHSFAWKGYSGQIKPISMLQAEDNTSWYDKNTTGQPTRYLHKPCYTGGVISEDDGGNYIIPNTAGDKLDRLMWFTLPDAIYTARIWARKDFDVLFNGDDVPKMPFEFHPSIVAGAIARMVNYGQVQIENAVIWPGIYKMHIEAIKTYNRKLWETFQDDNRSDIYLL